MGLVKSLSKNLGFLIFIYIYELKKKKTRFKLEKKRREKIKRVKMQNNETVEP